MENISKEIAFQENYLFACLVAILKNKVLIKFVYRKYRGVNKIFKVQKIASSSRKHFFPMKIV